jgi:hypothetical protein
MCVELGLVAGVALAAVACQQYPFLYRPHQRIATTTVHEIVMNSANTDILFVIDNSGSMQEEQINVIRNTGVFISALSESENAYQVGVVTTNALDQMPDQTPNSPPIDGGRLRMKHASNSDLLAANPDFGLGGSVDLGLDIPCANTTRDPAASTLNYLVRPALDSNNLEAERCHLIKDFMATVASLGTDGSGTEAGLLAAREAFDPQLALVQDNNKTFLRDAADLALIFLSDEEDCSRSIYADDRPNSYCYEAPTLNSDIPVDSLVGFFAALKDGGVRKVRGALIAGGVKGGESGADFNPSGCRIANSLPSSACACWSSSGDDFACTYPPGVPHPCEHASGCTSPGCEALAAVRYHGFMNDLRQQRLSVGFSGGTYEDSICQEQYDRTLLNIARTVVLTNCFELESPIDFPDTIRLTLRQTDSTGGTVTEVEVPRCVSPADCVACSGALAHGAWQLTDPKTICLQCGLKKGTGDDFLLTALTEMVGFDDGGTP